MSRPLEHPATRRRDDKQTTVRDFPDGDRRDPPGNGTGHASGCVPRPSRPSPELPDPPPAAPDPDAPVFPGVM